MSNFGSALPFGQTIAPGEVGLVSPHKLLPVEDLRETLMGGAFFANRLAHNLHTEYTIVWQANPLWGLRARHSLMSRRMNSLVLEPQGGMM